MKILLGWAVFDTATLAPVRTGNRDRRVPKIYRTQRRAEQYCTLPTHVAVPLIINPQEVLNARQTIPSS